MATVKAHTRIRNGKKHSVKAHDRKAIQSPFNNGTKYHGKQVLRKRKNDPDSNDGGGFFKVATRSNTNMQARSNLNQMAYNYQNKPRTSSERLKAYRSALKGASKKSVNAKYNKRRL